MPLTDREQAILDFERNWWLHDAPKEALIREQFGSSADAYYQELAAVLDAPDAMAYDPLVVRRLRRQRERRRRERMQARAAEVAP